MSILVRLRMSHLFNVVLNVVLCATTANATNLLVNGSFENGTYSFGGDGAQNVAPGESTIAGWSVITKSIAPILNTNSYSILPQDGTILLDMQGYYETYPYGGVQQTISTQAGSQYRLSFWIGVQNSLGNGIGPASVIAAAGATSQTFTNTLTGAGNQWQRFTMDFTASAALTTISLSGQSTQGGAYIGLDNAAVEFLAAGTIPGDYNNNGNVDAADYAIWRDKLGTSTPLPNDPIGGTIGSAQFNQWRTHFNQTAAAGMIIGSSVPEPTSALLLGAGAVCLATGRWLGKCRQRTSDASSSRLCWPTLARPS